MHLPNAIRTIVAGTVLAAVTAGQAHAGGADDAAAQALFDEARQLMRDGRFAEACPKLEDSDRLAPGIGTEFNLADCYEHTGRLASAWAMFLKVAAATKLKGQTDREQVARDRARALEPRIPRLEIQVPENAAGLQVERDGQPVPESSFGMALPVDPGPHRIEARAPGKTAWSTTVAAEDGQVARVTVPRLEDAPDAPAAGPIVATTDATTEPEGRSSGTQKTLGWVALGGSAAFLGAGILGLVERNSAVSSYNADSSCPPVGKSGKSPKCEGQVSDASTWETISIAGFVGSGALAITSAVLLLTAPSAGARASAPPRSARVLTCGAGPGTIGVACGGVF
jgi:hypothetical protein